MFSIRPTTTLLLWAVYCGLTSAETVITCDDDHSVHRLSCDNGVIQVTKAMYGRTNKETCSQGRPPQQLTNTACSDTLNALTNRCNGKKVCEVNSRFFQTSDPCIGIFKYMDTTYTCVPATRIQVCEHSLSELTCDHGLVISIIGADYGRRDQTTCIYQRPPSQVQNIYCSKPVTATVAQSCNGNNRCNVTASNQVFGDPCVGTYKYLEVAYTCNKIQRYIETVAEL